MAHREAVAIVSELGWGMGLMLTPLVTYYVRDWTWIQRITVVPEFYLLSLTL